MSERYAASSAATSRRVGHGASGCLRPVHLCTASRRRPATLALPRHPSVRCGEPRGPLREGVHARMRIWLPGATAALAAAAAPAVLATQSGLAYAEVDKLSGAPLPPRPPEKTSPILDRFYILAAFYTPVIYTDGRIH